MLSWKNHTSKNVFFIQFTSNGRGCGIGRRSEGWRLLVVVRDYSVDMVKVLLCFGFVVQDDDFID